MGLLHVEERVPLAPLTTFEVGGPARFLAEVEDEDELLAAFAWARARSVPVFVLGGGSNLVVADRGLDALVVRLRARGIRFSPGDDDRVLVRASAGEPWDGFVERCVARDLAGLECLSGIPGQVGATPIQNVGAYGCEVADVLHEVEVLRPATGAIEVWSPSRCEFAYRDSAFKRAPRGEHVVLGVTFALVRGGAPTVRYAELERHLATHRGGTAPTVAATRAAVLALRRAKSMVVDPADENRRSAFKRAPRGEHVVLGVTFALVRGGAPTVRYAELERHLATHGAGTAPTVAATRAAVLTLRRAKSMVVDPTDENRRSAGSFFTNPFVDADDVPRVRDRARQKGTLAEHEGMPAFPAPDGRVKLSAGWLIERAGFPRGTSRGVVGLSTKHALALVNRGGATGAAVVAFAREVQAGVVDALGVRLEVEPELLGFTPEELGALAR